MVKLQQNLLACSVTSFFTRNLSRGQQNFGVALGRAGGCSCVDQGADFLYGFPPPPKNERMSPKREAGSSSNSHPIFSRGDLISLVFGRFSRFFLTPEVVTTSLFGKDSLHS